MHSHLFIAAFALLAVATCVPVWLVERPPYVDLAQHVASVNIWRHIDDPAYRFREFYELRLGPNPYWVHYVLPYVASLVMR